MPTYDLLLSGGTVVDPAQKIHDRRDVAFKDGGSPPSPTQFRRTTLPK